jgi:cytoskeletal protein CcmA (bactofilin family)
MKNMETNGQYSRIENSTKIKGEIISEGDLRIDGVLEGTLKTTGKVIIGKEGVLIGGINCQNADIEGHVKGNLFVEQSLSLKATSKVEGEVITDTLMVEAGATFNATCSMDVASKDVKKLNTVEEKHAKEA